MTILIATYEPSSTCEKPKKLLSGEVGAGNKRYLGMRRLVRCGHSCLPLFRGAAAFRMYGLGSWRCIVSLLEASCQKRYVRSCFFEDLVCLMTNHYLNDLQAPEEALRLFMALNR